MAVSWGFAMLLALTLVAIITFSQPLFQSDSAVVGHTQSDLKITPQGVIARGVPLQNLLTSKTLHAGSSSRQQQQQQRSWTRKLIQRSLSPPGGKQQQQQQLEHLLQISKSHTPGGQCWRLFSRIEWCPLGPTLCTTATGLKSFSHDMFIHTPT